MLQNLKILSTFQGHKIDGQNIWIFFFFFLKRQGYVDISPEQKSTWCHIIFIHKSCNEIVNKIVFISLKAGHK